MSLDPFTTLRFYVTLLPGDAWLPPDVLSQVAMMAAASFTEVTGLSGSLEVKPYAEGGRNDYQHQLPVRHSWEKLVLKRGLVRGTSLWDWYRAGLQGRLGARRDGTIVLLDAEQRPSVVWTFRGGLATKWTGPELNASGNGIAVESVEITHNGIEELRVFDPTRLT